MDNNYIISIIGTQELDGDKDTVEVMTTGSYIMKNGKRYINYKEYDSDNPNNFCSNTVKVDGDKVTIMRSGDVSSRLVLQKNVRHQCHYGTPVGDLMIGVFADTIDNNLNDDGGELFVSYTLDFNAGFASRNEFKITIKHKGVE